MEEVLWYVAHFLSYAMGFSFVWGILVMGLSSKQDQQIAYERNPTFVLTGNTQTKACLAVLLFLVVYIPVTGMMDSFVYIAMSLGLFLGAIGLWRVANRIGSFAFEPKEWRKVRKKTQAQSLLLMIFTALLVKGSAYLETSGMF